MTISHERLVAFGHGNAKPTTDEIAYMANELRYLRVEYADARDMAEGQNLFSRDPDGDVALDFVDGFNNLSISFSRTGRIVIVWYVDDIGGHCTLQAEPEVFAVLDANMRGFEAKQ